jgi:hypothetical protein
MRPWRDEGAFASAIGQMLVNAGRRKSGAQARAASSEDAKARLKSPTPDPPDHPGPPDLSAQIRGVDAALQVRLRPGSGRAAPIPARS